MTRERLRGPAAHVAHRRRKQPIGTQHLGSDEPDHLRDVLGDHLDFGLLYLDVAAGHDVGGHDTLATGA